MIESAIKYLLIAVTVIGVAITVKIFVLPRLLRALMGVKPREGQPLGWRERVELRYQNLHTLVWMFAWFKLRLDPMFRELPDIVGRLPKLGAALDLGCGYGVAGSAILEWNQELKLYAADPNPDRVRAASRAFGSRGEVAVAGAPDFETPGLPSQLDAVFIFDVIHFLSDAALELTLRRIRASLGDGGHLLIRAPMPAEGIGSLAWNVDKLRRRVTGAYACYRTTDQISAALTQAGFTISRSQISGGNGELRWFLATAAPAGGAPAHAIESEPAVMVG